ncbi:MAG: hypothetical protein ACYC6M_06630 [Terriglobales bacterium]
MDPAPLTEDVAQSIRILQEATTALEGLARTPHHTALATEAQRALEQLTQFLLTAELRRRFHRAA